MSLVSCWLFFARREISSEMSTAESSCTKRSSSIFCCNSAIGCSKSRKVCFIDRLPGRDQPATMGEARIIAQSWTGRRIVQDGIATAPCCKRFVGDDGAEHEGASDQSAGARILAHQKPNPHRADDRLEQREQA